MGLRYAKRSREDVCSPNVLDVASIPIPNTSAIRRRLIFDLSNGSKKIYNGAIITCIEALISSWLNMKDCKNRNKTSLKK
tara:strand:- start:15 stop:254 length:240 start_codon:yes stop_codon:yes gene_type:complete